MTLILQAFVLLLMRATDAARCPSLILLRRKVTCAFKQCYMTPAPLCCGTQTLSQSLKEDARSIENVLFIVFALKCEDTSPLVSWSLAKPGCSICFRAMYENVVLCICVGGLRVWSFHLRV